MVDTKWAESHKQHINNLLRLIHDLCDEVVEHGGSVKLSYEVAGDEKAYIVIGPQVRRDYNDDLIANVRWDV